MSEQIEYMDYGAIVTTENPDPTIPQIPVDTTYTSQVYRATHGADGSRLPLMHRSFISFSYGGKYIEDFDLIAVNGNKFLERKLYADFEDNVTTSNVWDGQIYWSSHFKANTISFELATDGITEKQLNRFKQWFKPGTIRELILAEAPNRAILARVSSPPQMNMLPFEHEVQKIIGGTSISTSTTLYKGSIKLSFVMDDPLWYSVTNSVDYSSISESWTDDKGNDLDWCDQDVYKIVEEDNVPFESMFGANIKKSGETVATISPSTFYEQPSNQAESINPVYYFYGGNGRCYPTFTFTLTTSMDSNGYIVFPNNKHSEGKSYNIIVLEGDERVMFKFTTPGIYTSYNQIISMINNQQYVGRSIEELKNDIRIKAKHYIPRQKAIAALSSAGSDIYTTSIKESVLEELETLFLKPGQQGSDPTEETEMEPCSATFTFNGKTGQASAAVQYNNGSSIISSAENVGDMVCSEYLHFDEQNEFSIQSQQGNPQQWVITTDDCYKLYADCALKDFIMNFKYMYL